MNPDFSGVTKKLPFFVIFVSSALVIFVCMHPPIATSFTFEYRRERLLLEGFILYSLSVYLSKSEAKIFVILLIVFFLYMVNWFFSAENIENVLSYFNKFMFLLLISSVLRRRNDLALLAKNIWIMFWAYSSIMGIIGYLLMISNLVSPTVIAGADEGLGNYYYYNYPLIGNFLLRSTDLFLIPRYSGFLFEPGMLAFFFGFNMIVAKRLVVDAKKCQWFFISNMIAGLLTMSYAFVIFLIFFFLLRLRIVAWLVSNKSILIGLVGFICFIIITTSSISILDDIGELLPYSSAGAHVQQYVASTVFLGEQSLDTLVFGAGILPFNYAIGGGASAGIFDVLASRGIILLGIWLYVLYMKAKHIPGLFAFILFYSLVFDYWHFPLFMIGLAIVASLDSANKYRMQKRPSSFRRNLDASTGGGLLLSPRGANY